MRILGFLKKSQIGIVALISVVILTGCQGYSNPPDLGAEAPAYEAPPTYAGAGQVIEFKYRGSGN